MGFLSRSKRFTFSVVATLIGITMVLAAAEMNVSQLQKTECLSSCGNATIPYPFGTSSHCCLHDQFLITCTKSYNPPKPFLGTGDIEVLDISIDGLMRASSYVASYCYNRSGLVLDEPVSRLTSYKFPISSSRNRLTTIGCDIYAFLNVSMNKNEAVDGCMSLCPSIDSAKNGSCSGIGCCQTSIPDGVKDFSVNIRCFNNHTKFNKLNTCGYAFVVESEAFEFSMTDLSNLHEGMSFPMVLDWSVGNVTCGEAQKNMSNYLCQAMQSECSDLRNGVGYQCKCLSGFEGNPYLTDGCKDIDECTTSKPCVGTGTCTNFLGSYACSCPIGFEGDGKTNGSGCINVIHRPRHPTTEIGSKLLFYVSLGFLIPGIASFFIIWKRKERKLRKMRQIVFARNGGLILRKVLSRQDTLKIFTADEVNKSPTKMTEQVVLNKFELLSKSQIKIFIGNLVTLSRTRHHFMADLLGCCLETQVPVLVYEFLSGRDLLYLLNDDDLARSLSWCIRLKIAAEIACALSHLHSLRIIHGAVSMKSIVVLQDCTVKLCGFDLIDDALHTQETRFDQRTKQKDVYSFGMVLISLLSGKCPEGDDDPRSINLDPRLSIGNEFEQLTEIAKLAKKCLSINPFDRPNMEDVETSVIVLLARDRKQQLLEDTEGDKDL